MVVDLASLGVEVAWLALLLSVPRPDSTTRVLLAEATALVYTCRIVGAQIVVCNTSIDQGGTSWGRGRRRRRGRRRWHRDLDLDF